MIYLWIHMKFFMKRMSCLWKNFLIDFNIFMEVCFMKELKTNFWDFVHKLFEKTIILYLCYRTNIYTHVNYILCIFMLEYP